MNFKLIKIALFVLIIYFLFECKPKEEDFIDYSMDELCKAFEPKNVFIIVECTDDVDVIKIHIESTTRKNSFLGDFYTYCYNKNKCIDIIVKDKCIDVFKLTNKKLNVYSDIIEKDTIYEHTGDEILSEFKHVFIRYNIKTGEIISVKKGEPI